MNDVVNVEQVFVEESQSNLGVEGTVESVAESDLACSLDPVKEVRSKEIVSSFRRKDQRRRDLTWVESKFVDTGRIIPEGR